MKLTLFLPLALFTIGCDGDNTTDTDMGSDTGMETSAIVGDWNSSGDDVAPLLAAAPLLYTDIDASFEADGSYQVVATNSDGNATTFSGTYTVDASTNPHGIMLIQTLPQQSESNGIFEIDGTTLTYEVVQTSPDFGFVAPTPETDFGSTSGNGIEADVNTQVFIAQ